MEFTDTVDLLKQHQTLNRLHKRLEKNDQNKAQSLEERHWCLADKHQIENQRKARRDKKRQDLSDLEQARYIQKQ